MYVESQAGQNEHDAVDTKICPNLYDNVDSFSLIMTKVNLMVALKEMSLGFIIITIRKNSFYDVSVSNETNVKSNLLFIEQRC